MMLLTHVDRAGGVLTETTTVPDNAGQMEVVNFGLLLRSFSMEYATGIVTPTYDPQRTVSTHFGWLWTPQGGWRARAWVPTYLNTQYAAWMNEDAFWTNVAPPSPAPTGMIRGSGAFTPAHDAGFVTLRQESGLGMPPVLRPSDPAAIWQLPYVELADLTHAGDPDRYWFFLIVDTYLLVRTIVPDSFFDADFIDVHAYSSSSAWLADANGFFLSYIGFTDLRLRSNSRPPPGTWLTSAIYGANPFAFGTGLAQQYDPQVPYLVNGLGFSVSTSSGVEAKPRGVMSLGASARSGSFKSRGSH